MPPIRSTTALRGVPTPKTAMILMLAGNVLNMVLDPIFMFGYLGFPAMGIQGAAIASITALALTLLAGLFLLYTGRANVRLHRSARNRCRCHRCGQC